MKGLSGILLVGSIISCSFAGSACAMTYSEQQDDTRIISAQDPGLQESNEPDRINLSDSLNNPYSPGKPLIKGYGYLSSRGWEIRNFSLDKHILRTGRINLVTFSYQVPLRMDNNGAEFEYILDGYDQNWKIAEESGAAIYSNIDKGIYTFRLRPKVNNKSVPGLEVSQSIEVLIPIWSSSLALILYFLMFLGGLTSFIQYRTQSLRRANQILREKELGALEVARQREELSIKNKNITDSIRYAQKIQEALLPSDEYFKQQIGRASCRERV